MSAFLGPIHYKMYNKIQLLDELSARLAAIQDNKQLINELNEQYNEAYTQPLEKIIDQNNIHAWLSGAVQSAELRFCAVVSALLENNKELSAMMNIAHELGRERALEPGADIEIAYRAIDDALLDGMPCDGGRQIVSEDENEIVFSYDTSLHPLYALGEKGALAFAALREALLFGMLENSRLKIEPLGEGCYKLLMGE